MSIFYPTSSLCSPLSLHNVSHPPPTPYRLLILILLSPREPINKVHRALLQPKILNESVPSGFDGSLPPLVDLEVQPSSHVNGALGVNLEGILCSPHCENSVGEGVMIIAYNS